MHLKPRFVPATVYFRLAALVGLAIYVAGALVGWFSGTSDGESDALIHPHELVGGRWVWLGLVPVSLALLAPFNRRWLSFLWIAALPPLLFAIGVSVFYEKHVNMPFPYFFLQIEERHWGLPLSIAGGAFVLLAFVFALLVVILDPEEYSALELRRRLSRLRPARRRLAIWVGLLVACAVVGAAITVLYDPEAERKEDRLMDLARRQERAERGARGAGDIMTHCERTDSGLWRCAYEIEFPDGSSSSSSSTFDGSAEEMDLIFGDPRIRTPPN